jgi:hypothetical protein
MMAYIVDLTIVMQSLFLLMRVHTAKVVTLIQAHRFKPSEHFLDQVKAGQPASSPGEVY